MAKNDVDSSKEATSPPPKPAETNKPVATKPTETVEAPQSQYFTKSAADVTPNESIEAPKSKWLKEGFDSSALPPNEQLVE
jgi:hypothetical protein